MRATFGPVVEQSAMTSSLFAPTSPEQTFCTMSGVGRLKNAVSVPFATSSAELATCAPLFASSSRGVFRGVEHRQAVSGLEQIAAPCGAPIRPTPMNP